MRLLYRSSHGDWKLTKNIHNNIPAYAILSHTWGRDDEEVTFLDMENGSGSGKEAYKKIEFCGKQAARDGLQHFWVDTCCIDKSSSAELSESINSMFQYYESATVCYAYLEDVTTSKRNIQDSRWFTRGWTLQELLAPWKMRFFNHDWKELGTRESLATEIATATKIDRRAFMGDAGLAHVRNASVAQKMAWAADRKTTRAEDLAYCLLGLFDVNMPLLYGEGGVKAFERLQEEIIRRNLDRSLLACASYSIATARSTNLTSVGSEDTHLLAMNPRHYGGCEKVLNTSEDTSSFSLTNQGLQITVPIIRMKDHRNHFMASLSCVDGSTMTRIGLPLRSVAKSEKVFVRQAQSKLITISDTEFRNAKVRDICILRHPQPANRRLLRINVQDYVNKRWLFRGNIMSLLPNGWTILHDKGVNFVELPAPGSKSRRSYAVELTDGLSELIDAAELKDSLSSVSNSTIIVRVDVDATSSYSASVSIHDGRAWSEETKSERREPHLAADAVNRKHDRYRLKYNLISASQILIASVSWRRTSGQDQLVLDIGTNDGTLSDYVLFALETESPQLYSLLRTVHSYYRDLPRRASILWIIMCQLVLFVVELALSDQIHLLSLDRGLREFNLLDLFKPAYFLPIVSNEVEKLAPGRPFILHALLAFTELTTTLPVYQLYYWTGGSILAYLMICVSCSIGDSFAGARRVAWRLL